MPWSGLRVNQREPVGLDLAPAQAAHLARCAWYGDPAFCLDHPLLKCLWTPAAAGRFLACFDALTAVGREDPAALEARAAELGI